MVKMNWNADNNVQDMRAYHQSVFNYDKISKVFRSVVYKAGFICIHKNRVLLVKQSKSPFNVGPPKGCRNNHDKSAFDTATRELYEETKLDLTGATIKPGVIVIPRSSSPHCKDILIYFIAEFTEEPVIKIDMFEIIKYYWIDIINEECAFTVNKSTLFLIQVFRMHRFW